ncbi:DUF1304 domain-containing protein [Lactococcus garvieae]|nr:DUF1304 domain-containing protein [Lactococcus garvieae]
MSIFTHILIILVALEFFYILYLETLATTSAQTSKVFNLSKAELKRESVNTLLKNQGVYNGLIAIGLLYGAFLSSAPLLISRMLLVYILLVATYGSISSDKKIIFTQGGLAALALLSTFI